MALEIRPLTKDNLCTECISKNQGTLNYANVEMSDDGIYKVECSEGHKIVAFFQKPKFELLFDLGAMALIDGYQREAVSSFAASLERFYEFCIEVFLINNRVTKEQFEETWKLFSSQSERQLGAFYFLYLREFNEVPKSLDKKQTEFRNKVIHKGYIPTKDEVMKYANCVYNYIIEVGGKIREKSFTTIGKVSVNQQTRADEIIVKQKIKYDALTIAYAVTIIDIEERNDYWGKKSFDECLEDLKLYLESSYNAYVKE